ncbi:hypothetical protein Tco_1329822 [Tanacetum coccineum]
MVLIPPARLRVIHKERLEAMAMKRQLSAKVIITELSIRSDLHLADVSGIDCLPTATIFEELAWMGVPIPSNDPLLSGEDIIQLTELMILCTNLQKQVLDLEKAKDAQAKEIAGLKKRDKESLGAKEDASKQGRIKIVDETHGRLDDAEMFDIDDLHDDEVIVDWLIGYENHKKMQKIDEKRYDDNEKTLPQPSAPTTVIDELTLAQTLIEIKHLNLKLFTTATTLPHNYNYKTQGLERVVVQEPMNSEQQHHSSQAS